MKGEYSATGNDRNTRSFVDLIRCCWIRFNLHGENSAKAKGAFVAFASPVYAPHRAMNATSCKIHSVLSQICQRVVYHFHLPFPCPGSLGIARSGIRGTRCKEVFILYKSLDSTAYTFARFDFAMSHDSKCSAMIIQPSCLRQLAIPDPGRAN